MNLIQGTTGPGKLGPLPVDSSVGPDGGMTRPLGAKPWLPRGMSFLSGLPEAARKRRFLMPVQVFADESSDDGQSGHFVMAGLLSHSENWAAFSDEWDICLRSEPRIEYFKMSEAASCSGQFHRFRDNPGARDKKLRALAHIINRHVRVATCSVIDLKAHSETWAKALPKPNSEPYFWPFQNTMTAACLELWDLGWRERFEMIFDENVIFGPRAKSLYPLMKACGGLLEPQAVELLPIDPLFRNDRDFLPLQAADLFAWWCRKKHTDVAFTSFDWVAELMSSVRISDYSQYYNRERMTSVLEMSYQNVRDGLVPPHLVEQFREFRAKRKAVT
jgi:hypothetical protein